MRDSMCLHYRCVHYTRLTHCLWAGLLLCVDTPSIGTQVQRHYLICPNHKARGWQSWELSSSLHGPNLQPFPQRRPLPLLPISLLCIWEH